MWRFGQSFAYFGVLFLLHAKPAAGKRNQHPNSEPLATSNHQAFLEICHPSIVRKVGNLINEGPDGSLLHPGQGDESVSTCTMSEVQEVIAATGGTMEKLWEVLALPEDSSKGAIDLGVPCMQLCKAVEAYLLKQKQLPPSSDVGCYKTGGDMQCDLDLRPSTLVELIPADHEIPDFHDDPKLNMEEQENQAEALRQIEESGAHPPPATPDKKDRAKAEQNLVHYEISSAVRQLARTFRIFPPSAATFDGGSASSLIENGEKSNVSAAWERKVLETSEKAQAYLSNAVRQFRASKSKSAMAKWYGQEASSDKKAIMEVQRVLNSVMNMLDNVVYKHDTTCDAGTFAYVYPSIGPCTSDLPGPGEKCTKNGEGKFVFYLCDHYMKSSSAEQIETLVHEGSHHATAFTKDVCMDEFYMGRPSEVYATVPLSDLKTALQDKDATIGSLVWVPAPSGLDKERFSVVGKTALANVFQIGGQSAEVHFKEKGVKCAMTAYERRNCAALARLNPKKALRNADSFCYYISDVNTRTSVDPCKAQHGFCIGDQVVYNGPTTSDGHGASIRSNLKGLVMFPGSGFSDRGVCVSKGVSKNLKIGDQVEMCKSGETGFSRGEVTAIKPLTILPNGWDKAYHFQFLPWDNAYTIPAGANVRFDGSQYAMFVSAEHLKKL